MSNYTRGEITDHAIDIVTRRGQDRLLYVNKYGREIPAKLQKSTKIKICDVVYTG